MTSRIVLVLTALSLIGLGPTGTVLAQPRQLTVAVQGPDGEPLDGIILRLREGEPDARVRQGGLTWLIPASLKPGDDVTLDLQDDRYAILEPPGGVLRLPGEGAGQTTRIVLVPQGDPRQLQKAPVRRSLGRQVVEELDGRKGQGGEPGPEDRLRALAEVARQYGLDPETIDAALQAWSVASPEERDRKLLERYLRYFPRAVESVGNTVRFTGPVRFGDGSTVVINPTGDVIIVQSRFFLREHLERLALGEASKVEVASAPQEAMEGARCAWRFSPADFLTVVGDGRKDCSLAIAMPTLPNPRYGPRVELRVAVEVFRGGTLLDEVQESFAVSNGIALWAKVEGAPLTPTGQVLVTITSIGEESPLPADYQCSWSAAPPPLRRTPVTDNACVMRIDLRPSDTWTPADYEPWMSTLKTGRGFEWVVTTTYKGEPIPGGAVQFPIEIHDPRSRATLQREYDERVRQLNQRLREETERRVQEKEQASLELQMRKIGLPPLAQVTAETLKLRAEIGSRGWWLQALYVGEGGKGSEEPALLISGKRSPLQVLYSADGTNFTSQGGMGKSRDLQALAQLDHYWLKLEVSSQAGVRAGPFRLKLDGPAEFRAAARRYWQAMDAKGRRSLACGRFTGLGTSNSTEARVLLPILESVSVRRDGGTVWRTVVHGADLQLLSRPTYELVPEPLAGAPYVVRLQWADGSREEISCPASYGEGGPRNGTHYTLKKVAPRGPRAAEDGPEAIEVFLERDWDDIWRAQFERRFQPTYIRYSTDGEVFATVRPTGRFGTFVRLGEPRGSVLHLSFVNRDGTELAYRGPVDFGLQSRSQLLEGLEGLEGNLEPSCREFSGRIGSDGVARGKEVRCVIEDKTVSRGRNRAMSVGHIASLVDHIEYGCSPDRMDLREDFTEARAWAQEYDRDLDEVDLVFLLEEPCETVFSRMILNDGSQSQLMVIPVLSGS